MDGTILNSHNKVSIKTKEMIDNLRNQGIYVFIATGRAFDEITDLVPEGFQVDGCITSNGMAGYIGEKVVFQHSLSLDLVKTLIEKARQHKIYYELFPYGTSRITLNQDKHYVEHEIRDPKPDSVEINEWLSRKHAIKEEIAWKDHIEGSMFSKFYFFARTKEHINEWKDVLNQLKLELDFTISTSSSHNVEVMFANVNKATGIKQMLAHFGLSEVEIMAIGDSYNDMPMFEFASYAVAMKNAPDPIKQVVDDVTEFTCDEDGIYHYLYRFFSL